MASRKTKKPGAVPKRTRTPASVNANPVSTLTPDQVQFMEHLLAGLSIAECVDRTGVPMRTAYSWLERVDFQVVLEQQREALRAMLGVERDRIVLEHCRIAFANAADYFVQAPSGAIFVKDPADWTPAMRSAVSSIEVLEEFAFDPKTGKKTLEGYTKKIRFHDKQKALDALAKMIGVDAAPKAPVGPDGQPVQQIAGYIVIPAKEELPKPKPGDIIEGHLEAVRGKSG